MVEGHTVKSKVTDFIFEKFPLAQKRHLGEQTSLLEAGIVDSIGILEIVAFIEQTFSIRVEDDDLVPENFGTIAAITAFVERKLARPELKAEGVASVQ